MERVELKAKEEKFISPFVDLQGKKKRAWGEVVVCFGVIFQNHCYVTIMNTVLKA